MVFGFIVLSNVTGGSLFKSLMMAVVGLIIGTIGLDPVTGDARFTFGFVALWAGSSLWPWRSGFSASARCCRTWTSRPNCSKERSSFHVSRDLYPSLQDLKGSILAILRGPASGSAWG